MFASPHLSTADWLNKQAYGSMSHRQHTRDERERNGLSAATEEKPRWHPVFSPLSTERESLQQQQTSPKICRRGDEVRGGMVPERGTQNSARWRGCLITGQSRRFGAMWLSKNRTTMAPNLAFRHFLPRNIMPLSWDLLLLRISVLSKRLEWFLQRQRGFLSFTFRPSNLRGVSDTYPLPILPPNKLWTLTLLSKPTKAKQITSHLLTY